MPPRRPHRLLPLLVTLAVSLVACTTATVRPTPSADADGWSPFTLPGKRPTLYTAASKEGRPSIRADADRSASMWRRPCHRTPAQLGQIEFSWWVDDMIDGADLRDTQAEDAPARVILAFDGDASRLSARNRMVFELAQALTGEAPPYATLMYVWDRTAPVGELIVSGRSDRIRKIVVESGPEHRREWRSYRRDIAADYRRAFGEDPGALIGVALMTDADNTQSHAEAWYGEIHVD